VLQEVQVMQSSDLVPGDFGIGGKGGGKTWNGGITTSGGGKATEKMDYRIFMQWRSWRSNKGNMAAEQKTVGETSGAEKGKVCRELGEREQGKKKGAGSRLGEVAQSDC